MLLVLAIVGIAVAGYVALTLAARDEGYFIGAYEYISGPVAGFLLFLALVVAGTRIVRRWQTNPGTVLFRPKRGTVEGPGMDILMEGGTTGALLYAGISGFKFMALGYFSRLDPYDFGVLVPIFGFMVLSGAYTLGEHFSELVSTLAADAEVDEKASAGRGAAKVHVGSPPPAPPTQ